MKKTLAAILLLGAVGVAIWFGVARTPQEGPVAEALPEDRPDFEAQGVLLRQLDAQGKLQYEIEAERIVQLANGDVQASRLSFHHEPPGTRRNPQRWKLTAENGDFPAAGSIVQLSGKVRAEGTQAGDPTPLVILAEALEYDIDEEVVTVAGEVDITDGGNNFKGRGARLNIATGMVTVESGHGKISL